MVYWGVPLSSLGRWTYVYDLTVWPKGALDEWGQPSYGTPYLLRGSWQAGGDKRTDNTGQEFVPRSTYFFEAADGDASIPELDWYITRGDYTSSATPIEQAEPIRSVGGWGMQMFGDNEIADWEINT